MKQEIAFKDRLKEARNDKKLTQGQVADLVGKDTTAYGHYERGRNKPPLETMEKICAVLDVNYDWLVFNKGNKRGTGEDVENDKTSKIQYHLEELGKFIDEEFDSKVILGLAEKYKKKDK